MDDYAFDVAYSCMVSTIAAGTESMIFGIASCSCPCCGFDDVLHWQDAVLDCRTIVGADSDFDSISWPRPKRENFGTSGPLESQALNPLPDLPQMPQQQVGIQ